MKIFDCNVSLGLPYAPSAPPEAYAEKAETLLDMMAFCGIDRALTRHVAMEEISPIVGNQVVVEETVLFDTLEPSWAILPPQTGELGTAEEFVGRMAAEGIRALWAFPSRNHYLLNNTTFGGLFEVMTQRRIPLFISTKECSGGLEGYAVIEALLGDFPELVVVATDHGCWGEDRFFRPLIERYKNFHIDNSRYELAGGIRDFCDRYGPYRMLYGSGYPEIAMGGALLTLAHAEISDVAKEAIFGGNLGRLLQEVQP